MSAGAAWDDCRAAAALHLAESAAVAAVLLGADRRVLRANRAFQRMVGGDRDPTGRGLAELLAPTSREAGERLSAGGSPEERLLFQGPGDSVFLLQCRTYREGERLLLLGEGFTPVEHEVLRTMTRLNGEVVDLTRELERRNRELQRALEELQALHGILPICVYCRRIKDDTGGWQRLEDYAAGLSAAHFSHALCDQCAGEHWPEAKPR